MHEKIYELLEKWTNEWQDMHEKSNKSFGSGAAQLKSRANELDKCIKELRDLVMK